MISESPYLDPRTAATYLNISLRTLRGLVGRRAVAFVRVSPRKMMFRKADLDRFMDSRVIREVSP